MSTKQPKALQLIQGWEAIHDLETSEIEQLAWESCTEFQRLHTVNAELVKALQESLSALEWVVDQGGGPNCEHESGGVVCFCRENNAIFSAGEALEKYGETQ